ncbi:MAG TPA: HXXEE domain-containing protein [Devosiaceae bacterium]
MTKRTLGAHLVQDWVYGWSLAGLLLIALLPLFVGNWPAALIAVVVQLPIYMLHQFEEHADDRFGRFVTAEIGGGREVLPAVAIFWINVPGVGGLNLVSIWLAAAVNIGFGLIGIYLVLINAVAHIGQALAMRRYNPGLITAVVLFLPAGLWGLWTVSTAPGVGLGFQALGLVVAIAVHGAIVGYVMANRRRMG